MNWGHLLQAIFGKNKNSSSYKKGERFESYAEKFFPASFYDLLHRTSDYKTNCKRFVESSLKPDFLFRDKLNRRCFYVECKFRSSMTEGKVECCNSMQQLARYHYYSRRTPVFLFVGLGGNPLHPHYVFLIPLQHLKTTSLEPFTINQFRILSKAPMHSSSLWSR